MEGEERRERKRKRRGRRKRREEREWERKKKKKKKGWKEGECELVFIVLWCLCLVSSSRSLHGEKPMVGGRVEVAALYFTLSYRYYTRFVIDLPDLIPYFTFSPFYIRPELISIDSVF